MCLSDSPTRGQSRLHRREVRHAQPEPAQPHGPAARLAAQPDVEVHLRRREPAQGSRTRTLARAHIQAHIMSRRIGPARLRPRDTAPPGSQSQGKGPARPHARETPGRRATVQSTPGGCRRIPARRAPAAHSLAAQAMDWSRHALTDTPSRHAQTEAAGTSSPCLAASHRATLSRLALSRLPCCAATLLVCPGPSRDLTVTYSDHT